MLLTQINIIFATLIVSGKFDRELQLPVITTPPGSGLASEPHLKILPEGPQTKRSSMNLVLTCKVQVPNAELVKDIKWVDPEGKEISQDSRLVYSKLGYAKHPLGIKLIRLDN